MIATTTETKKLLEDKVWARRAEFALKLSVPLAVIDLIMAISMAVSWLFFRQYTQLLGFGIVLLILTVGAGLYPLFHWRGQVRLGIYLLLISFLIVVGSSALLVPPVIPATAIGYVVISILSYLLLGNKDSRWVIGISLIAFLANLVLSKTLAPAWFPALSETVVVIASTVMGMLALLTAIIVARLITLEQEEYFRQSQLANLEIEKRATAEQEHREGLERANREIEKRVAAEREHREHLQDILRQVRDAATSLNAAVTEILAATTQQSANTQEQSAAISETSTTVNEVKTISEHSIERMEEVVDTSQHTVEVSRSGQQAVADTIASMEQIKERVEGIAENILALSGQARQISDIIATVNSIATQSKVLALNASVEAARAGEHGKGFAVVAVEVRNLAEESRAATAQVRKILSEVQNGINATVMATEEGTKVVEQGGLLITQTQSVIEQLSTVIDEMAQAATQVMSGGRQQTTGIEQISMAMREIDQTTAQSMTSTQQTEKTARDLNELARNLMEVVEQYQ